MYMDDLLPHQTLYSLDVGGFFVCFLLQQLQGLTVSKTFNETRLTLPQGAINPFK